MFKRILVPLPGSIDRSAGEIDLAMTAAKAFGACVEALFIAAPPTATRGVSASHIRYSGALALAPVNPFAEQRESHAREAREYFTAACAAHDIPIITAGEEPQALPAACWREVEGDYVEAAVDRAVAYDLMVAASSSVMDALKDIAEQALLQTGRPVLLAPAQFKSAQPGSAETALANTVEQALAGTAMVAWDDSSECWHAVTAALPFLQLARAVKLVSVDRNKDSEARRASQAEALLYLRCHGIAADAEIIAPELRSVGDTLLAVAGEHEAGLMVMGAYSHSRLREMLLGGATRHILQHASSRPVLMAH